MRNKWKKQKHADFLSFIVQRFINKAKNAKNLASKRSTKEIFSKTVAFTVPALLVYKIFRMSIPSEIFECGLFNVIYVELKI